MYRITDRCGGFKRVMNDDDACALGGYKLGCPSSRALLLMLMPPPAPSPSALPAGHFGQHSLQKEVHILAILHHSGFADRVPEVLGVVQHWGDMYDPVRRSGRAYCMASKLSTWGCTRIG